LKGGPRHKQKMQSLCLFNKKKTIFCLCRGPPFKKVFFCQPFFEKIQTLCRGPPFKKVFFCQPFFEKIQTFGFPNKNGIFEKIQGFPEENLCPFKNVVFVRKPSFSPLFPEKGQGRDTRLENLCRGPPFKYHFF